MIAFNNRPADINGLLSEYPEYSIERTIINILATSDYTYNYSSKERLQFELKLRREIINAAEALFHSGLKFRIFYKAIANSDYWIVTHEGGFALRPDVKPSDAIRDIYSNGYKYGTECATAMLMIYYKALLEVFPEDAFNQMFNHIYLMNWHRIAPELREIGLTRRTNDHLPGDRRYFVNPDVNPETPEWQGENVIDLGGGIYYGHGIGRYTAPVFINALNQNRRAGADQSAYLLDSVGRPNFDRLFKLYNRVTTTTIAIPA